MSKRALIEQRREDYAMWCRLAERRRPGSRGYWRAHVHRYAAAILLDFAHRL